MAGVLALSACGGPTAADDGEATGPGPFWQHLEGELGETQETLWRVDHDEQQAAIARCMAESGFEYWPEPASASATFAVSTSGEEWEEGLRTKGWGQFTMAGDENTPVIEDPETPNSQYVDTLSTEARAEYEAALFGEWDPATGELIAGSEGCFEKVYSGDALDTPDKRYEDLLEEIRSAWEVAEAQPEVQAALDDYRACMTQGGFAGIRTDPNELLEAKFMENFPDMTMASNDPRLPELAEWEISLANAHLDCLDETDLAEVRTREGNKVEREIMERRSAEVDGYIAELRERVER